MTVPVRAEIGQLPVYKPGRNPEDLARELGLSDAVKLASNENPFGPLTSVIEAISTAASTVNRYPDNGAEVLVRTLANRFSLPVEQVAVGCGSVSLCQQLLQAYTMPGDEVMIGWRSFEAYPILISIVGATAVRVPLAGHVHDLDAMAAAVTDRTKVIFVCNPNNPTGTAVGRAALTDFLDRVPPSVLVVLDEAYREFVTDADAPNGVELMRGRPNVAVLRTFSKAYGLAGLRVGYLLTDNPAVAEAVRKTYVPFSVSTVAQAAAVASLAAEDELLDRCAEVVAERDRLVARLAELGSPVPPPQGNFVWLPLGDRALEFAAACEKRGVIVRPFAGDGVRVTVGDRLDNDAFCEIVEAELG